MSTTGQSFLLEVGCEEIPDRMLEAARKDLAASLQQVLEAHRLMAPGVERIGEAVVSFATPRRLAVRISGLCSLQPDETTVVTGPPLAVAYDGEGKPTRAAQGFAAAQGVAVEDVFHHPGSKGEVIAVRTTQKGRPAAQVLADVVPGVVLGLSFPKAMSWGEGGIEFVRPIRWLVALLEEAVVPIELAGLKAGRITRSRRGAGNLELTLDRAQAYEDVLRQGQVFADPAERRRKMKAGIESATGGGSGRVVADSDLEDTVLNMVEYPGCLAGDFPEEFLQLPAEVLITTLRHHQHCFCVADDQGALLPRFVAVVNSPDDPDGAILSGYRRVIAGRLADARFFYHEDRKEPLARRREMLERTRFHADLGSYAAKVDRMERLVVRLAELAGQSETVQKLAAQAATLSKCDLATQMENEFPELQGVVGGLYAREEGAPEAVWRAVYDQYLPEGREDDLPRDTEGVLLSLADRLDNLVGLMGVGVVPKGSRDPFALRRAALGVVRLLAQSSLHLPVSAALASARMAYGEAPVPWKVDGDELIERVRQFLEGRVRHLFEKGPGEHRYDSVSAVLAAGWDDLADTAARLEALTAIRGQDDFEALAIASKRIRNILSQAEESTAKISKTVREDLLAEPAEQQLYAAVKAVDGEVIAAMKSRNHPAVLGLVASLRPHVDAFFDTVLVMAKEEDVRQNRLALLARIAALYLHEADFAEIVVEGQA